MKKTKTKRRTFSLPFSDKENVKMFKDTIETVRRLCPEIADMIVKELQDQRKNLKLIASENYSSPAVQAAMGTLLTDKYAEGVPYHRFYAGCENIDAIEDFACRKACEVFGADHAYVQPHSGADANLCAFWAILNHKILEPRFEGIKKAFESAVNKTEVKTYSDLSKTAWDYLRISCQNQRLLAMDYYSGGHLTHGYRQNISAQLFDCYSYSVDPETGLLDYKKIESIAMQVQPLILLAGYSAYPGKINFRRMREIADKCGAVLMADMSHFAGLVAGKVYTGDFDPVKWADIVTTTTHKTLRGPRGGMILCKKEFAESVDKGCPLVLGGPLPHVMAAKAVALNEAAQDSFREYARNVVENAATIAARLSENGIKVCTGKTENHLVLVDVSPLGLTGRQAESVLRECGLTVNRNAIPNDPNGPWYTSGLRIGTPAVTTRGMGTVEMTEIADIIAYVLKNTRIEKGSKAKARIPEENLAEARNRIDRLLDNFPLYPEYDR
jgi:glycine hydroxymethyltransferase